MLRTEVKVNPTKDKIKPRVINARSYFATFALGVKWYNNANVKKIQNLRQTTSGIGHLPSRLAVLLAEDAEETGLAVQKRQAGVARTTVSART
ncbi:MAG: hypothetical protein JSU72_03665 [Deltaproteobacteria bacterium]|nr:MAG: hypothetical protein JSU72_03665 [Deltaproteobacteria bacterium]